MFFERSDESESAEHDPEQYEPEEHDPEQYEPDEYDPETELRDLGAGSPTIPSIETDEFDASGEVLRTFWITVLVINIAILLVSLGGFMLGFWGDLQRGGGLLLGGLTLLGLAVRRYRTFQEQLAVEGEPDDDGTDEPDTDGNNEPDTDEPRTDS